MGILANKLMQIVSKQDFKNKFNLGIVGSRSGLILEPARARIVLSLEALLARFLLGCNVNLRWATKFANAIILQVLTYWLFNCNLIAAIILNNVR